MPQAERGVTWASAVESIPDRPVLHQAPASLGGTPADKPHSPGTRPTLAIPANPWQRQMINYYLNEVIRNQYSLADSGIPSLIRQSLQRSRSVCGSAILLAQLHHQHVLTEKAHPELRMQLITRLHDDAKIVVGTSCEGPDDVFAVLQLVSCFSFLGGCDGRSHYLLYAVEWVKGLLANDTISVVQREDEWTRFVVKAAMWFDVLDAVSRGSTPHLLICCRILYADAGKHVDHHSGSASMRPVSGCETAVFLALAEIAALAARKRADDDEDRLCLAQLIDAGNRIGSQLSALPELSATSTSTEDGATRASALECAVFRACARVYLRTVMSTNMPDCPDIAAAAAETIALVDRLPANRLVLRLVALGICIAGCVDNNAETREALSDRFTSQSIEVVLSDGSSVLLQLSQLLGSYPRPFSESRVPPLSLLASLLWVHEAESACTRDHPESFNLSPSLIPAVFEANRRRPSDAAEASFEEAGPSPDDVAFATLTMRRETIGRETINVGDILARLSASKASRERYVELNGSEACRFLDALQLWLDNNPQHTCWRKAMRLLIDVAGKSNELPQSLFLAGVDIGAGRDPHSYGSFADVFCGSYQGQTVAVKRLRIDERGLARDNAHRIFCKEALLWRQLSHPHILQFIGVDGTTFRETRSLGMVSVWTSGGTIMHFVKGPRYSVKSDRRHLLIQVAEGLNYLHALDVTHGDLHGSNVFVTEEGHACLADFGLSVIGDATRTRMPTTADARGATPWLAPELLSEDIHAPRKTLAGDVFAFGRLCLAVCTKRQPFDGLSVLAIMRKVMNDEKPDRPSEQDCDGYPMSNGLWKLAHDCWEMIPADRPRIGELLEKLRRLDDYV